MSNKNIQVTLANRPTGWVQESDFKITETNACEQRNERKRKSAWQMVVQTCESVGEQ
jgi:hypothetical protein